MSDAVPTDPPPRAARGPEPARAGDEIVFGPLPVGALGRRSAGWWGAMTLILTEAVLFGYLLFSYAFLALHPGGGWDGESRLHPGPSARSPCGGWHASAPGHSR